MLKFVYGRLVRQLKFYAKGTTMKKKLNPHTKRVIKELDPVKPIRQRLSKGQILTNVAEAGGVDKKTAARMLNQLSQMIVGSLKPKGCGKFTLPGVLTVVTKKTKARPARKGINRFTGEPTVFKAKPAGVRVVARPTAILKAVAVH